MYLIVKSTKRFKYPPFRTKLNGYIGTIVLTIDKKVYHVRDEEVTDVTSSYLISNRNN